MEYGARLGFGPLLGECDVLALWHMVRIHSDRGQRQHRELLLIVHHWLASWNTSTFLEIKLKSISQICPPKLKSFPFTWVNLIPFTCLLVYSQDRQFLEYKSPLYFTLTDQVNGYTVNTHWNVQWYPVLLFHIPDFRIVATDSAILNEWRCSEKTKASSRQSCFLFVLI